MEPSLNRFQDMTGVELNAKLYKLQHTEASKLDLSEVFEFLSAYCDSREKMQEKLNAKPMKQFSSDYLLVN